MIPTRTIQVTYDVWPTAEAVGEAAAAFFRDAVKAAAAERGVARVAISGGTTPKRMFQIMADPAKVYREEIPWDKLELYWVDERCVPPTDADSNFRMTTEALLSKVPLPESQVHRMEGELDPAEAADRYETVLRNTMKLEGAESPAFDLLLLGMGDDGHTASLFPHTAALTEFGRLVVANHVPQKDTWRISLTSPVINQARSVCFLIEGSGKAEVLQEVLTGPRDPERLPSQLVRPVNGQLRFLLDEAAAAKLPAPEQSLTTAEGSHKVGTLER